MAASDGPSLCTPTKGLIALPDTGLLDPTTAATLAGGAVLLAIFVWHEGRTPAPMMPLGLFRSATFSGVNALTLLLYGALGGAMFLLPFALISVHGYSATMAGAGLLAVPGRPSSGRISTSTSVSRCRALGQ